MSESVPHSGQEADVRELSIEEQKARVRAFFDSADAWKGKMYENPHERFDRAIMRRKQYAFQLLDQLHIPLPARALDVGCGSGAYVEELAKRGFDTVGVDLSPEMVDHCRRRFGGTDDSNANRFMTGDIEHLPFGDDSFDVVICAGVFGYLHSDEQALRELYRVLKPNGYVCIIVQNMMSLSNLDSILRTKIRSWFGRLGYSTPRGAWMMLPWMRKNSHYDYKVYHPWKFESELHRQGFVTIDGLTMGQEFRLLRRFRLLPEKVLAAAELFFERLVRRVPLPYLRYSGESYIGLFQKNSGNDSSRRPLEVPAVIISDKSPNAYDLVRCLGREGISSSVLAADPRDIAFASRHCTEKVRIPGFEDHEHGRILSAVIEYASQFRERPVLLYPSDPELRFVWKYRKQLEPYYRFLLPPDDIFEPLLNKVLFLQFAQAHSFPVPRSVACESSAHLRSLIGQIRFPCIVKPAVTDHWIWDTEEQRRQFGPYKKALRRFSGPEELLEFCDGLPKRPHGFVIQEYIPGRDESICSFHGYFDEHSRCLGYFVGRKIRTFPMHTGGSTYIRTIQDERLAATSIRMLGDIGFRGIVKIDFKRNEQTGEAVVLEVNTRYNLWELLGAYAGVNLVFVAFRHQTGDPIAIGNSAKDDCRLLYLKQDLRALVTGYLGAGEWTLGSYLRSLMAPKYYRIWNPEDPLPFVMSVAAFVRRNIGRSIRRVLPRSAPRIAHPQIEENMA